MVNSIRQSHARRHTAQLRRFIAGCALAGVYSVPLLLPAPSASGQSLPRYRIILVDPPDEVPTVESIDSHLGINNRGEAVGAIWESTPEGVASRAFVWLPASNYSKSPGTHILAIPEGIYPEARKISISGIAVGRVSAVAGYSTAAWKWDLNTGASGVMALSLGGLKEEATDINDATPPVVVGQYEQSLDPLVTRGFRRAVGGPLEALDPVLTSHSFGMATAVSNSGFAVGDSWSNYPQCAQQQDLYRAASWGAGAPTAANLATLGTSQAEAITVPLGINNADPNMIVGYGQDPDDATVPCRERALFWQSPVAEPIALPYFTVDGQPQPDVGVRAAAMTDPSSNGTIQVVGRSGGMDVATLWRRVNNTWEAINLNTVSPCGGAQWSRLSSAVYINSCGWIVGSGTLTDGSPRAFILVPADACPGDVVGGEVSVPDEKVNVSDLLYIINNWGSNNCIADINGDATVNSGDLLAVVNHWGACACFPAQGAVKSLSQELADAGLTQADWNKFLEVAGTGTPSQKANYNCWMQRYLTHCEKCPACPGRDPFANRASLRPPQRPGP